jgi:hypothetical protein
LEINLYIKALNLWNDFKTELLYNNRFFIKHEVLTYVKNFTLNNQITFGEGHKLYRARLFTRDDSYLQYMNNENSNSDKTDKYSDLKNQLYKYDIETRSKSGFWGYNKEESFVPPDNELVGDGRVNPKFIKYLYTSEDPYTSMVEIRPYLNSKVSIAKINALEPLNIADFSKFKDIKETFEMYLILIIMRDLSKPSDSELKDYLSTQYIGEFVKSLGLDGIRFNSSLHDSGKNVTIFNYHKCCPISSTLYQIDDICFEASSMNPKNFDLLVHKKLLQNKSDELLKLMNKKHDKSE